MSQITERPGFQSIFSSLGVNPLSLWEKQVKNGHIRRVIDDEVKSLVLEISGTNVATTYITCPIKPRASLGISLPFLVMIVKNMKKYFTFEILILDDKDMHRRFRVSNFQSTTKVRPFCTTMPIGLCSGWNQIQFNLADFTRRAYGSTYLETQRIQIHANVRIRRIYFADRLYTDDELPSEYRLFLPITRQSMAQSRRASRQSQKAEEKAGVEEEEGVEPLQLGDEEAEGEEMPGAPPTPVELEPMEEPRADDMGAESPMGGEATTEPPTDTEGESPGMESPTTDEATTEMTEPPTPSDVPPDSEPTTEPTTTEGDTSAEPPAGEPEAVAADAPPADEAAPPPADEAPAEAPAEAPPAEEPPAEPAAEAPAEEAPKED